MIGIGPRQRQRDIHVCEHVFDRLKRPDGPPEGDALQRIAARHVERLLRATDLLERNEHGGAVESPGEDVEPFSPGAEAFHRRTLERQASMLARWIQGFYQVAADPR